MQYRPAYARPKKRGFTLLELLVALAVVSVAATLFFSLYFSSFRYASTATYERTATAIAEAALVNLMQHPNAYTWCFSETSDKGFFRIKTDAEEPAAGNLAEPPTALPPEEDAARRSETLYQKFRWRLYGRLPGSESPYYEVLAEVRWEEAGRKRAVTLTGAVPRTAVEKAP